MFIITQHSPTRMGEEAHFNKEFLEHFHIQDLKPEQFALLEHVDNRLPYLGSSADITRHELRRPMPRSSPPGPIEDPASKRYYLLGRIYDSIENRADRCRMNVLAATGLEMKLEDLARKVAVPGFRTGRISEESFQKILLNVAEHERDFKLWWDISESVTSAFDSIAALWWYELRLIFQFYQLEGITDKTYDFHKVLQHEKIKDRMLPLWNHLKLGQQDSPLKRVTELRNVNNHREDLVTILHASLMNTFDAEQYQNVFRDLKGHITALSDGYTQFAQGYQLLLKQLHNDKNDF